MSEFCSHLKKIRKSKKITQKEAANAAGISERNYQEWEYGKVKPAFDSLVALADFFDISIDYLVGRTNNPTINK